MKGHMQFLAMALATALVIGAAAGCDRYAAGGPAHPDETAATEAAETEGADEAAAQEVPCEPAALRADALNRGTQILAGLTLAESTAIARINESPADFEGQVVQVEGWVGATCSHMGCWTLIRDAAGNQIRLKVTDGVVDFRRFVGAGRYVVGEGIYREPMVWIDDHGAMVGMVTCTP